MSRLRTYAPMKRKPPKARTAKAFPTYTRMVGLVEMTAQVVPATTYQIVDRRSEGRCEVILDDARCRRRADDHHHTMKPRRDFDRPDCVMAICRSHHDAVDRPYSRGKLQTLPNGDGTFACRIVTAPDKFTYRTQGGTT